MTLYCAVVFTVGTTGISGIAAAAPNFRLHRAAAITASFTPTILTLSLALMMIQGLAAMRTYTVIARTFTVSLAIAILVSCLLVTPLNVCICLGENDVSFGGGLRRVSNHTINCANEK